MDVPGVLDVVEVVLPLALELRPVRVARVAAPAVDDDVLDLRQVAHRLVHRRLQVDRLAAPVRVVAAHHDLRARVLDPAPERLRPHPGVDDAVDRADPGAGQHGDDPLRHQRHVEDDPVALLHAQPTERVGEPVHLAVQPVVRERPLLAVLAHPDHRRLVPARAVDVTVDAVQRGVQLPAHEPAVLRRVEVQHVVVRLDPVERLGLLGPERRRIRGRRLSLGLVVDGRLVREPLRRLDGGLFGHQRLDGALMGGYGDVLRVALAHGGGSVLWGCCLGFDPLNMRNPDAFVSTGMVGNSGGGSPDMRRLRRRSWE